MAKKKANGRTVKKTSKKRSWVGNGTPGPGRPKGVHNKVTNEIRLLAQALFDEAYWKKKYERMHAGKEHAAVENQLLAYAYGKPKERIEHSVEDGMAFTIRIGDAGDRDL